MSSNPILDEIYAAREKLLADVGGDLHAYIEGARTRALASGRQIATQTQPAIEFSPAGNPTVDSSRETTPIPTNP